MKNLSVEKSSKLKENNPSYEDSNEKGNILNRKGLSSSNNLNSQSNKSKENTEFLHNQNLKNNSNNFNFNTNDFNSNIVLKKKFVKKFSSKSQAGKNDNGFTKTNQDSYIILEDIINCKEYKIFGVLDGHGIKNIIFLGTHGHFVSNALTNFFTQFYTNIDNYSTKIPRFKSPKKNLFTNNFNISKITGNNIVNLNQNDSSNQLKDNKSETILQKLKENNFEIIRNSFFLAEDEVSLSKFDVQFSGSTTVIVFLIGKKIICANAGDSRAIIINEIHKKTPKHSSKI